MLQKDEYVQMIDLTYISNKTQLRMNADEWTILGIDGIDGIDGILIAERSQTATVNFLRL